MCTVELEMVVLDLEKANIEFHMTIEGKNTSPLARM